MFDFALPTNWRSGLQRQVRKLEMSQDEPSWSTVPGLARYKAYSTSTPTRHPSLETYSWPNSWSMAYRTLFKTGWINERQLLEITPNAPSKLARDEFVWRVHSYLDSLGLCHFCKKHCGNAAGACPGPIDRSRIDIPSGFATPENRPTMLPHEPGVADYYTRKAHTTSGGTSFNSRCERRGLEPAAVAALESLESQLLANEISKAEQADLADAIAEIFPSISLSQPVPSASLPAYSVKDIPSPYIFVTKFEFRI
ncbi:hypothetical protein PGT21_000651 [Puccinia graminis f. sp. tritici]|uniref:Uncharacterized protein n=1 Tax=Puccinia graminis f. sp. tritici TaxID=56615 RepID=A0A5B0LTC5_PUCGR|nr:hypothetical protein PGT21_000651 [Puccinia graminis f. sp. tritici]